MPRHFRFEEGRFTDENNPYQAWESRRQQEGHAATEKRARRLIRGLLKRNQDCILVSHGFYMRTLLKELKRQGFTIDKSGMGIANLAQIIATK